MSARAAGGRRTQILLGLLGTLLLVAGVAMYMFGGADTTTTAPPPTSTTATPTPSSTSARAPSPTATATATGTPGDDEHVDPDQAKKDRQAAHGAPQHAEKVMRLLAQGPRLGQQTWWNRTRGMLSPQGINEMSGIKVEQVPFSKVTGRARLLLDDERAPNDSGHSHEQAVSVIVPTNVGPWTVLVTAGLEDGSWQVSSISAPDGVH